jgi:uncharacterized protein YlxW (UPF0749 family)
MRLPRARIGTLMLLVVIAGLVIALAAERRRHAEALAAEKSRMEAARSRFEAARAELMATMSAFQKQHKQLTDQFSRMQSVIQMDREELEELRTRLKDR